MTPEMLTTLTEQVAELVQTYSNNYPQFQRATYNETQVRVDFVNRFFKLLGWDVDNERGLPQHLREVTHEATVAQIWMERKLKSLSVDQFHRSIYL